ncbi:MAG: helix-turn-helix transcriptional regulator [Pseudomonadota bacterium]
MKGRLSFTVLLVLQLVCGLFLLWDILQTLLGVQTPPISWAIIELVQIGATLGLIFGVVATALLLSRSLQRQKAVEDSLRAASGAFSELLEDRFDQWALTPAERDVALFAIKGLSTHDIAEMRQTSEGTVKAQTNAIYRKAGVSGRPQLLSLFIDDLMDGPLG